MYNKISLYNMSCKLKSILIFCCFLLSISCNKSDRQVNFYYWKSRVEINEVEQKYFNLLKSSKLYIRFFDIDKQDDKILPIAKINLFEPSILDAEYIPVVFITNRTFVGISQEQIHTLAENTSNLINTICQKNNIPPIKEIQFDCDWTEKTRNDYFLFLRQLQGMCKEKISCTLRLHQIKFYKKTGVPPVSKGYLMCYATSNPGEQVENSILDIELLKDYTSGINSYPLDFDVALPIYSWGILTNHLGKIRLINNVTLNDVDTLQFRPKGNNTFEAIDDFPFHGFYLSEGFTLRIETITSELLKETRQYLKKKIKKPFNVIYYHLDKPFLERYKIEDLQFPD